MYSWRCKIHDPPTCRSPTKIILLFIISTLLHMQICELSVQPTHFICQYWYKLGYLYANWLHKSRKKNHKEASGMINFLHSNLFIFVQRFFFKNIKFSL
jgi:hypothetical protein